MKTYFDCIPCFVRQALDAVRFVTDDEIIQEKVLRDVLKLIGDLDLGRTPPEIAYDVHGIVKKITGSDDPYTDVKKKTNSAAMDFMSSLGATIDESPVPFETAARIAVAGNLIDFGFKSGFNKDEIQKTIDLALHYPIPQDKLVSFRQQVESSDSILYLTDNAGEIAFDKLFIELLPLEKVTVAVKAVPFLNDALMEDAEQVGLTDICTVIDNGSPYPGTVPDSGSEEFRELFNSADIIISKGMANYETLSDIDRSVWFMLMVKCPVIAMDAGLDVGTMLISDKKRD